MQNRRFGKDVNLELPKDEPPSRQASIKYIFFKKLLIYSATVLCVCPFFLLFGGWGGLHDVIT